ncbi:methionine--tRNA ligase [Candidatus Uhrbacteria bacterium]|nr:methionine--tRNA ligase [Candidatus Uhrbacteria bacterium]
MALNSKKFYITTPIYYVNDKPHIGHAYTMFAADALARYFRMRGFEVNFLTGTDENSQKNIEAAKKLGKEGDIKGYLDEMAAVWAETWDSLGMTNDDFIRTTETRHKKAIAKFIEVVWKRGDIYKGTYEGWYCVGCETFLPESDLESGLCPIHKKPPEKIKEENYFFKLSKYRKALLNHIKKHPDFIAPESRRNEVVSYIQNFMEDISITRASAKCGTPFPKDKHHAIYVWFDALINYLSAVGYGADGKKFQKYWPADLHLVGKDIIKFHCALWPAMLLSAGLPLPKKVFAHGFFTIDGEKISKSLGNAINPVELTSRFGVDALRYYLLREIGFGNDGDFSPDRMSERYNADLANGLGNLTARILGMAEKYFGGIVPPRATGRIAHTWLSYEVNMGSLRLDLALSDIWDAVGALDKFIDTEQPWVLAKIDKKRLSKVIYTLLESLRNIAWMVAPFLPDTADKIFKDLGFGKTWRSSRYETAKKWGGIKPGSKVKKGAALFPRLEISH